MPHPRDRLRLVLAAEVLALLAMTSSGPIVATVAFFAIVGVQALAYWLWDEEPPITRRMLAPLGLLLAFVAGYFGLMAYYRLSDAWFAFKYGASIPFAYVAGNVMGRRGPKPALIDALTVIAGFVLFAAASVYLTDPRLQMLEIKDRVTVDPWGGDPINGPLIGVLASLGMCMVGPALFAGRARELPWLWQFLYAPALLLLAAVGFYSNLFVENRSPVLAMSMAFCASAAYVMIFRSDWRSRLLPVLVGTAIVALVGYAAIAGSFDVSGYGLYHRFEERGLGTTGRYDAWRVVLQGMLLYPEGGREAHVLVGYAHNLWLDVIYDVGIIPAAILVIFQAVHVAPAWRWLRRGSGYLITVLLVAAAVSMLAACVAEPVIAASQFYFPSICLFLGMILGLDEWARARGGPAAWATP